MKPVRVQQAGGLGPCADQAIGLRDGRALQCERRRQPAIERLRAREERVAQAMRSSTRSRIKVTAWACPTCSAIRPSAM